MNTTCCQTNFTLSHRCSGSHVHLHTWVKWWIYNFVENGEILTHWAQATVSASSLPVQRHYITGQSVALIHANVMTSHETAPLAAAPPTPPSDVNLVVLWSPGTQVTPSLHKHTTSKLVLGSLQRCRQRSPGMLLLTNLASLSANKWGIFLWDFHGVYTCLINS